MPRPKQGSSLPKVKSHHFWMRSSVLLVQNGISEERKGPERETLPELRLQE